MQSFLVTMLDWGTGEECRIIVQTDCTHDMQQFVNKLAANGQIPIANPVVIDIDDRAARHIPVINPAAS